MRDELNNENNMKETDNPYQTEREHTDEEISFDEAQPVSDEAENVATPSCESEQAVKPEETVVSSETSTPDSDVKAEEVSPIVRKVELLNSIEQKKKQNKSTTLNKVIMVAAVLVFIVSATVLIRYFADVKKSQKEAQQLAELVSEDVEATTDAVGADGVLEKYRDAYNTNADIVGWIKVPNTTIDHPVVIGTDNNEYLKKSFYGVWDKRGTIFMDYRDHADTLCKNTILYGHNYLDSTMFSDLEKYKDIEFYRQNPVIEFNTIYKNYKWKVFCVFLTNASASDDNGYIFNYIYPFMTDNNFEEYVGELSQRSLYFTAVDVQKTDKILTLSTCTRDMDIKGNGETNARCVVVARLVRDGESLGVDTASATVNDNPRYPQIWYNIKGTENPFQNAERWYPEGAEY